MRYEQVNEMIESMGLPCAYMAFQDETEKIPPYIVFFYPSNDDFYADDTNYQDIVTLRIELYTADKRFDIEENVQSVLKSNRMTYEKDELYLSDEKMFEIVYQMEVVINEQL